MESKIVIALLIIYIALGAIYLIPLVKKYIQTSKIKKVDNLSKSNTDTLKGFLIVGIMFSHIVLRASYFHGNEVTNLGLKSILVFLGNLGTIGVAGFFVLSGYGNSISINKCQNRHRIMMWFWRRVKKIIVTFVFCYMTVISTNFLLYGHTYAASKVVWDICTLTIPSTTTWYLKIQMLLYVFTFLSMIFSMDKKTTGVCITILCIVYAVVAKYMLHLQKYWWNTVFCYPLGYFVGMYKQDIKTFLINNIKKTILILLIIGCGIYGIGIIFPNQFIIQIFVYTIIGAIMIAMIQIVETENSVLKMIGVISFELYLIHIGLVSAIIPEYNLVVSQVMLCVVLSVGLSGIIYFLKRLLAKGLLIK